MKTSIPRFSKNTIPFLVKASRQKKPDWLEKNRDAYEANLLLPLQHLARHLKESLASKAVGYHFPQKGIGRLKRPSHRVEKGGGLYKDWMTYSASVPAVSRFDHNPNLFFLINPDDPKEGVLVAGGLYMPSSRQLRSVREAIAEDASAFEQLFSTREFKRCFRHGFSDEKIATRPPRGFAPDHPKMNWLKLQAYFVWRPYSKKEFYSPDFAKTVARDWTQILRLNELLYQALEGRLPKVRTKLTSKKPSEILDRLAGVEQTRPEMDF